MDYVFFCPLASIEIINSLWEGFLLNPNHKLPGHIHCSVFQTIILLGSKKRGIEQVVLMGAITTFYGSSCVGVVCVLGGQLIFR